MSNLREIKRKIKSVHNTQKTVNAMKLVSTAKLEKAEETAKRSKICAQKIDKMLNEISFQIHKANQDKENIQLSCFQKREKFKNVDAILITADKGFCGGFSIKTIKAVDEPLKDHEEQNIAVRLRAIGKTGIEYSSFQKRELLRKYLHPSSSPDYGKACEVTHSAVEDYLVGETDAIVLVHSGHKNMITQKLKTSHLIPVEPKVINEKSANSLLEFEPEEREPLEELMKTYLEYNMYYIPIDSLTAEHSARVQAVDNTTNNAKARVKQLNLAYNRTRQEFITTGLIEIIGGVEAMK